LATNSDVIPVLVAGTQTVLQLAMSYFVYIMASRRNGTLYIGVTNDLLRRVWEHRQGIGSKFVKRYGVTRLVFMEPHDEIERAIQREKTMKEWPRAWKLNLIERDNPEWRDLYETLNG
jgi:putative endonuclease